MTYADRWLLPDGVEDLLPQQAQSIEQLRRRLLNLYAGWGYEMVIPPLLEYTDSLLIGLGRDLDLMTFKVTDQLSGRTMGIRADITPQIARIDAHSLKRSGPSRFCYAGHVLHAKPKSALATRLPIQAGVELYGEAGLDADIEVVSLLLESLQAVGLDTLHIDLGHVGIFRALAEAAGLNSEQEETLFDLLQGKAVTEIAAWIETNVDDAAVAAMLQVLPSLAGGQAVLAEAREKLAEAPDEVLAAIDELEAVAEVVAARYNNAKLYFDLSELRGYHYHTGIVFAAFAPGYGEAVANGGRYDHIGEVFGNARAATGFAVDLTALVRLGIGEADSVKAIFAPATEDAGQWQAITELRSQGEKVICGLGEQAAADVAEQCDRQLVLDGGEYRVQPLNS
jgi:ATP phosphoribosyltransferase regulatory subunit